jgi:hypothetical protein
MVYRVALAPDLEITPQRFVDAWNAAPPSRNEAEARLERAAGADFDQSLMEIVLSVGHDLSIAIAASALYDLIKITALRVIGEHAGHRQLKLMEMTQPDGSRLVVVTRDDAE